MDATATMSYLDEPPAYDFKELSPTDRKDLIEEVSSLSSLATNVTSVSSSHFTPTKTLLVNARGIRMIRLPIPSGQLEIPITNTNGDLVYVSTREKRCSGNAILYDNSGKELLASEYQFGPGREPKIRHLGQGDGGERLIVTKGKWTSRRQDFVLPDGKTFTWRYIREADNFASIDGKEKKRSHLVLDVPDASPVINKKSKKVKDNRIRVAELVRNDEARTPGTGPCDAGNGGQLEIDSAYCEGIGLRDDVIVASCLMMLKKEIDRRRAVQFMVLAGIVG
jgi:hypothetical protein